MDGIDNVRIIIDLKKTNDGGCSWNICQEPPNTLDNENLVDIFIGIIEDLQYNEK